MNLRRLTILIPMDLWEKIEQIRWMDRITKWNQVVISLMKDGLRFRKERH